MLSRAAYLEYLFNAVAEEIAQAAREGTIERPLNLRKDIEVGHGGFLALDLYLRFVPDDLVSNLNRVPSVNVERA